MPKEKTPAPQPAEKKPRTRPQTQPIEPFAPPLETETQIVINARGGKISKMAAGRPNVTDHLTITPPKEKARAAEPVEIVIKNSQSSRQRPTTQTAPRRRSQAAPGTRSRSGSETNGSGGSRTRQSGPQNFHTSDKLPEISDNARHEITGIVLIVVGLILFFGLVADQGIVAEVGKFAKRGFGVGAFLIPPLIIVMGATYIWEGLTDRERFNQTRLTGVIFMVVAFVSFVHLFAGNPKGLAEEGGGGGLFAYYINSFLGGIITGLGAAVLWLALFLVGLMLALSMSLRDMGQAVRNGYRWFRGEPPLVASETLQYDDMEDYDDEDYEDEWADYGPPKRPARRAGVAPTDEDDLLDELLLNNPPINGNRPRRATLVPDAPEPQFTHTISLKDDESGVVKPATAPVGPSPQLAAPAPVPAQAQPAPTQTQPDKAQRPLQQNWKRDAEPAKPTDLPQREWQVPSVNILANFSDVEVNPQELRKKARMIENTLSSFGVEAYVREVNTGPTVTQFALEPGVGVKVARITALANDLALALAAPTIRLEAPVPGQSRVGIEVPNAKVATVGLREIMEADEFTKRSGRLKFALGRDVSGQPIVADLAKMPHLLIAGSTGSGKSVCLNSIVAAYLLQHRPNELQFIMIDPKMVELSTYNGIPHLRFPVVTQIEADPEKERNRNDRTPTVMSVLKWSIREMERRYKQLSLYGHRNIESYNKAAGVGNDLEKLPYTVLIVDELADLMMVAPEEAESAICRLAQKARAVGIHLILATQRPSVDVVTGLIKANFPSRITFAVTSQIDSRVILDMGGAEKLLGRGDMLYLAADAAKPMRVQGVYVGDDEIDTMVRHWRQQNDFLTGDKKDFQQGQLWPEELQQIEADSDTAEGDELFEEALELVREARTASVSLLQRRLRIGFNRAARLIDELEGAGVIGHAEGSRPRPVLLAEEDLNGPSSLTAAANSFEPIPPTQAEPEGVPPYLQGNLGATPALAQNGPVDRPIPPAALQPPPPSSSARPTPQPPMPLPNLARPTPKPAPTRAAPSPAADASAEADFDPDPPI